MNRLTKTCQKHKPNRFIITYANIPKTHPNRLTNISGRRTNGQVHKTSPSKPNQSMQQSHPTSSERAPRLINEMRRCPPRPSQISSHRQCFKRAKLSVQDSPLRRRGLERINNHSLQPMNVLSLLTEHERMNNNFSQ